MLKKLVVLIILFSTSGNIFALDTINPISIGLDIADATGFPNVEQPKSIAIFPLEIKDKDLKLSAEEFYKGIFHYTTKRLGFPDIPFHYVVTSDGVVYSTNVNDERLIPVKDLETSVLIAYLNLDKGSEFTNKAARKLSELILEISNKNGISPDKSIVKKIVFQRTAQGEVSLAAKDIFGLWNQSRESIVNGIVVNYSPRQREFSTEITNVKVSKSEVKAGEEFDVLFTIKNNGPDILYGSTESSLYASRVGSNNSSFYLNGVWIGQSEFDIMDDSDILKVGDSKEFTIKFRAPLAIGNVKEEFELKTYKNEVVNNNKFSIEVSVINADKRIVEIQNTETGFVRVRSAPSTVAEEVSRVSSGERFFVLEEDPNGFLRIDLGGDRSGWIAGWLTNSI